MKNNNKKSIIIGISVLFLVTLVLLGLTYAYYRTRIVGNNSDTSISVISKLLEIKYVDGKTTFNMEGNATPGYSATKEFSVENTGEEKIAYAVVLENIINEFSRTSDWSYVLTKNDVEVSSGIIPVSDAYILNLTEIEKGVSDNFVLTINYINSNEDQSIDIGKNLSFKVNITDAVSAFAGATEGTLLAAIGNDNTIAKPIDDPSEALKSSSYKTKFEGENSTDSYNYISSKYITYADSFKFNETDGTFTLINPKIGQYKTIYQDLVGKYINTSLSSSSTIVSENLTDIGQVLTATKATSGYAMTFKSLVSVPNNVESIVSSTEDDYGTSVYFRGAVNNNFVNYSGMCWRILRVQGNGIIKLILADKNNECDSSSYSVNNVLSAFVANTSYVSSITSHVNNLNYEGSLVESEVLSWVTESSLDTSNLIETEFCNDTSIVSEYYYDINGESIDGSNLDLVQSHSFTYGGYERVGYGGIGASMKCDFTGINGTKATKYVNSVGVISADEAAFAGVDVASYLYSNTNDDYGSYSWYHTMTPSNYYFEKDMLDTNPLFVISPYGFDNTDYTEINYWYVRPVIAIKSTATVTGLGTQSDPYEIS